MKKQNDNNNLFSKYMILQNDLNYKLYALSKTQDSPTQTFKIKNLYIWEDRNRKPQHKRHIFNKQQIICD